jgi:hypothetical protein
MWRLRPATALQSGTHADGSGIHLSGGCQGNRPLASSYYQPFRHFAI